MSHTIDSSPLPPIVRDTMLQQSLPIKRVLQNGPRYAVVSTEIDTIYAIFKMVIPGAVNPPLYEQSNPELSISLQRTILKEIRLLELLDQHREHLKGATTHLFRYSTEDTNTWYLRELFRGKPMGNPLLPFRFDQRFFEDVSPQQVVDYFFSLHSLTSVVSPELTNLFSTRWPNQTHVQQLVESLNLDFQLPQIRRHHKPLGSFIAKALAQAIAARAVITHREPYGAHTFTHEGQLGFIDWERSSLGHPLFDLALIWLRAFDNTAWRSQLVTLLREAGYLTTANQPIWDMLLTVDAIASHNYFQFNPLPDPIVHRHIMTALVEQIDHTLATYVAKA